MMWINQFGLFPGPYQHYKNGKIYIVQNIITHLENYETHAMEEQKDPLVVYRDLEATYAPIENTRREIMKVYARRLSEFTEKIEYLGKTVRRFEQV